MKKRTKLMAIFISLTVFALFSASVKSQRSVKEIDISTKTDKKSYFLGEPVTVNFSVTNKSEKTIQIPKLWAGNSVAISNDGINYKKTGRGKWDLMLVKISKIDLLPGQTYQYENIDILSGGQKPDYSHLNDRAAKQQEMMNDRLTTGYAFPEAGKYFVKGTFGNTDSEPMEIKVEEPQGEDLEVWNKIKDDINFAYFIQEGEISIPDYKPKERAEFEQKVEDIINQYANSFYAQSLNQSLEKFKASEAKRQAFKEKIGKP